MRYIKLFESFDRIKLKQDISDILVELVDQGFDIKINLDDSFIEVEIEKLGVRKLSFESSPFLFKYEDISDYLKMVRDYMEHYSYRPLNPSFPIVIFQKRSTRNKKVECTWSRFLFLEEKFINREIVNKRNSDESKFVYIKLEFKI